MVAGRQSPPVDTLEKIANALEVETWMLLKDPAELDGFEESDYLCCPKCGAKLKLTEID